MRKRMSLFLLPLLMLTSCGGSNYKIRLPYGDGTKENEAIGVSFSLAEKIKNGYTIKGTAFAEKDAPLTDMTTFSLTDHSPFYSEDYKETTLVSFRKEDFQKKDDGSYSVDFNIVLENLNAYFLVTGEGETKNAAFFIHGTDFRRDSIVSYNTHEFSYAYDGTTVTIFY